VFVFKCIWKQTRAHSGSLFQCKMRTCFHRSSNGDTAVIPSHSGNEIVRFRQPLGRGKLMDIVNAASRRIQVHGLLAGTMVIPEAHLGPVDSQSRQHVLKAWNHLEQRASRLFQHHHDASGGQCIHQQHHSRSHTVCILQWGRHGV
jgi:hypothetical protein